MWCRQKHKNLWIMGTEGTSEKTLRLSVVLSCLEISVCVFSVVLSLSFNTCKCAPNSVCVAGTLCK